MCSACGKKIKIIAFITHAAQIRRILSGIGWPDVAPEFDPPYELSTLNICQLVPETIDGFPAIEEQIHYEPGPDPPHFDESCNTPLWQDNGDSPHWED